MATLTEFLAFWGASYAAHVALYFVIGFSLIAINKRFPDRRIPAIGGRDRRARMPERKEIRQSLKTLLSTAFCTAGALFAQYKGWALAPLELTWLSALWTFVAIMVLHDAWVYFEHRLMHTRLFYRRFHLRHHRAVAPNVWTNDAFSVVDAFLLQAFFLILPFFIPVPPLVLIAGRIFDQARGMIGHSGYEHFAGPMGRWPFPFISTVHHDLHHQRFNVNFANQFSIWDRVFGTLDPDYDRLVKEIEEKGAAAVADQPRRRKPDALADAD